MSSIAEYINILREIDDSDKDVTDWEAGFIESLLSRNPSYLSDKQIGVINRMKEKYLDDKTPLAPLSYNDGLDDIPY